MLGTIYPRQHGWIVLTYVYTVLALVLDPLRQQLPPAVIGSPGFYRLEVRKSKVMRRS